MNEKKTEQKSKILRWKWMKKKRKERRKCRWRKKPRLKQMWKNKIWTNRLCMTRSVESRRREDRSRVFLPLLRSNEPFILKLLFYKLLPEFLTDVCTFMGFYTVYASSPPCHLDPLEKLIWASCSLRNIDFVVMVLGSRHPNDNWMQN